MRYFKFLSLMILFICFSHFNQQFGRVFLFDEEIANAPNKTELRKSGIKKFFPVRSKMVSMKATKLKEDLRKLWSDHVFWTRLFIISALLDLPDKDATTKRLLQNQKDLGNAIIPFYGSQAGNKLAELLKDHILIAADLVTAAKMGDKNQIAAQDKKWHKNAKDIAQFLSKANPNWPKKDLLNMLNKHLLLTKQEAVLRLQKCWKDDVSNFDKIYNQALHMANALSDRIIKQFPDKF